MKKTILILTAILFSFTAFSKTPTSETKTPLQKLIVDVGVIPYQITLAEQGSVKSVNLGLGYEITKKLIYVSILI